MNKILLGFMLFCSSVMFGQNAQDIIDGLKVELKTNPEDKRKATIYSDLTWYYSNISLDSAMIYGKKAIYESTKLGDSTIIAQVYGDVGNVYLKKGDYEECLKYFNKVLTIRKLRNDIPGLAKTYSGIGMVYNTQNKYELSMKNYLIALEYVNKTTDEKIKNNIKYAMSGLLLDLKDYKKAMLYSKQSIAYFEKLDLKPTLCPMYINNGNICLGLNDTLNAMKMYEKAKIICNVTGNKLFLSKALNNIGIIKVAQKKYDDSKKLFEESKKNRNELNSEVLDYKGKFSDIDVLNRAEKFKESKVLLLELKNFFEKNNDIENLITAYKILIPVCSNLRENDSVAFYQIKFLDLNQKLNDSDILKRTIELETKYQTAKKDKLLLENEAEAEQQKYMLLAISVLALFIGLIGFLIYRQQKLKNRQQVQEFQLKSAIAQIETQNQLQEQRLSISRDLHDNIGAQLTFIISSVDNIKYAFDIQNLKLDNRLQSISTFTKATIVELRDTIWAMNSNQITFEELRSRIHNFIENAKIAQENIDFQFSIDDQLNATEMTSVYGMNVYRTIQEAINNALKYANAKSISIHVQKIDDAIVVKVKDDGIGFDSETVIKGNGLANMEKRIESIGGVFSLKSTLGEGTLISIILHL